MTTPVTTTTTPRYRQSVFPVNFTKGTSPSLGGRRLETFCVGRRTRTPDVPTSELLNSLGAITNFSITVYTYNCCDGQTRTDVVLCTQCIRLVTKPLIHVTMFCVPGRIRTYGGAIAHQINSLDRSANYGNRNINRYPKVLPNFPSLLVEREWHAMCPDGIFLVCQSGLYDTHTQYVFIYFNSVYLLCSISKSVILTYNYSILFEMKMGFEPMCTFVNSFADCRFQPLSHFIKIPIRQRT